MMSPRLPATAILLAFLCASPARSDERMTAETAAPQISAALSLMSGGMVGTPGHPAEVTPDGDAFRVRVPVPALTEPPDAALTARAKPLAGGVWDISAVTLPSTGAFTVTQPGGKAGPAKVTFTIGAQAISGRIDPTLAQPSPFSMDLRDLVVRSENAGTQTKQTIARQTFQGTLTGDPQNRMTMRAQGTASNWRISARDPGGAMHDSTINSTASSVEVEGLDRAQAERLRAATQALTAAIPAPGTGGAKPTQLTDQQRKQFDAVIDALQGLAGRINIEETAEGIHFAGPADTAGDIGRARVGMTGESHDDHLQALIDLTLHDLKVTSVPPEYAGYLPTLVQLRPALSGIRTSALMRLLHHAAAGAPPDALQAEALALMNEPGARLGIEDVSLSAGPLEIEGSGRMLPSASGVPGMEAHLTARGVDATLASVQSNPKAQQIVPLIFLAKGMGRAQGDALVWDLTFADGVMTVNGIPLGQRAPAKATDPQRKRQQP
jgi:Uncharacterized protein conserved in bacteria (DUF2125)